ncbi:peptidoglycan-binding protein [Clostridium sp. OS1-26]|uniref:peptidoglycan-binding protein n=1 Tax=Clostridium sp. OS1-26 TaxID=3070681 RepID=UPI0027DF9EE0|nr:peptidoglycan-binding protein [Clostridium sp. OS1-26]WML33795.1 peptidoglycan-binding protein [Clostridium sp. OS1-26]
MDKENIFNIIVASIGTILSWCFGSWEVGLQVLFGCMILDYAMRLMCGTKVYGHKEWLETSCPGTNYPLQDIKDSILSGQIVQSNYNSDLIRSVQHDLQRVSCLAAGEVNADGVIGPKTKAAIKQFRYVIGVPDSENIDSQLIDALNAITKMPTIGEGWSANVVATRFIQWFIGINPNNGVFNPNTVQKVKEWQKREGIWSDPDGVIRPKDWSKILK